MSRSKEGRDLDRSQTSNQQDAEQTSDQANTGAYNQGRESRNQYTGGRESWRDFPRRQSSPGGRSQEDWQSSNQQITGGYERRRGYDRTPLNQANTYGNRGT